MTQLTDSDLIAGCISGRREALAAFACRYSDLIYRSVQHVLRLKQICFSFQDVEDLHHTVFLDLFDGACRKLSLFSGKNGCSFSTWIRVVTVRVVLNQIRKKDVGALSSQTKRMSLENGPELPDADISFLSMIEKKEQMRLLKNHIEKLSARDRLFVHLHFDQEMPLSQVAREMGVTTQNAYTMKHRVIKRLKAHLTTDEA